MRLIANTPAVASLSAAHETKIGSCDILVRYTGAAVSKSYTKRSPSLVTTYTSPYFPPTCMATGKSSANSGGKNRSAFFLMVVCPGAPSSITCSLLTGAPSTSFFCANAITGLVPTVPNTAACASRLWLLPCSTEYSCMNPLTNCGRSGAPGAMPTSTHHFSVGSTR